MSDHEALQRQLTAQAVDFYHRKQRGDRNLYLSGDTGIVDHHFGIGKFDLTELDRMTQEEIGLAIRQLEDNQAHLLINSMGEVLPEHHILDAGCGRGGTTFRLIQAKGCKVEGITIAPYQAGFAHEIAGKMGYEHQVGFRVMDMLREGYPENIFDHVITNETTMYMVSLVDLFREFSRVLKPGGRYTLATWCINQDFEDDNPFIEPINRHYGVMMHTDLEYKEALAGAGFSILGDSDLTELAIPHWEIRSRWEQASGVEKDYLEGHKERAILYKMISAIKTV